MPDALDTASDWIMGAARCEQLILGTSVAIERVREMVRQMAPWPVPVLIEGPTGAGKELVAQAIHLLSGRAGRFVAVNVCAVPETLFEATVFGHTRGAFTGAQRESPGYVLEADRGTLFLDEIGSLPLTLQAKLLRVLDRREVRQVGSSRDRASDFRLVSATNENLTSLVMAGSFRRDFYYRLRGGHIVVPPLTDRAEDVPILARHFVHCTAQRMRLPEPMLRVDALRALCDHGWPGNVRELGHAIELAFMLSGGGTIAGRDVVEAIGRSSPDGLTRSDVPNAEKIALSQLLERHDWVVADAARELDVTPKTIYSRLQRAGIQLPKRSNILTQLRTTSAQGSSELPFKL